MKVAIVGCGYVGLVTGVGLASVGHKVIGIDVSQERVDSINRGQSPFYEPGLEQLLSNVKRGRDFRATTDFGWVAQADVVMICVGTPSASDGSIDLSMLREAVGQVVHALEAGDHYQVVVIRSTVVPRTTEFLVLPMLEQNTKFQRHGLGLAVNPEFLREGQGLEDFLNPDRIIIGEIDAHGGDVLSHLYEVFNVPIFRTNPQTAEMIKYTSNTLLATLISFSNEIARICESIPGVDVEEVLAGVHADRRLTPVVNGQRISAGINHYLKAGCGYGGSCLPKDLRALIHFARERGLEPTLLEAVHALNTFQPIHLVNLAERWIGGLRGKRVLVLGLAFKAGTDDIRESPGITVAVNLLEHGALVTVADPLVKREHVKDLLEAGVEFVDDPKSALKDADVCFITTSALEFKFVEATLRDTSPRTKRPIVVDGRRVIAREAIFTRDNYIGVGVGLPVDKTRQGR